MWLPLEILDRILFFCCSHFLDCPHVHVRIHLAKNRLLKRLKFPEYCPPLGCYYVEGDCLVKTWQVMRNGEIQVNEFDDRCYEHVFIKYDWNKN